MRGTTTKEDLERGLKSQEQIKNCISAAMKIALNPCDEMSGDYIDIPNQKYYEIKEDPLIGGNGNFMMEIFADITPKGFEKGWAYRYERLDYLCFFNKFCIFIFDYRRLREFFWTNFFHKIKTGEWWVSYGVKNNVNGMVVLIPFHDVTRFLKTTIKYERIRKESQERGAPVYPGIGI